MRGIVVLIGYLRVAPGDDDDAAAQRRALAEAGCEQVVVERPGPEDTGERPILRSLLARIHPGDIVVVPQLDSGSVKNLGRYAANWNAWWPRRPSSTAALT